MEFSRLWPICLFLATLVGCGPAVLLDPPVDWPGHWHSRTLYHTPSAYIYASSEGAAGEADRLVIETAKDMQAHGGRRPAKGLVIVTDADDALVASDLKALFELKVKADAARDGKPEQSVLEELEQRWQEQNDRMTELGLSMDIALRMAAIPVPSEGLATLCGFERRLADQVEWSILLPTKTAIQKAMGGMLRATMKKKGIGPVAQAAMAPIMALATASVVNLAAAMRQAALFSAWAPHAGWSPAEALGKTRAYRDEVTEKAMGPLMAAAMKEAKKRKEIDSPAANAQKQTEQSNGLESH